MNVNIKRITSVMCAVALLAAASACSNSGGNAASSPAVQPPVQSQANNSAQGQNSDVSQVSDAGQNSDISQTSEDIQASEVSQASVDSQTPDVSQTSEVSDSHDLNDPETIEEIKNEMAEEATANGGTISLELWCSRDDLKFEKKLVKEFKEKYADSRYSIKISVNSKFAENSAGSKILESPIDGADVFNFADDQLSLLVQANAIAATNPLFRDNVVADNTENSVNACKQGDIMYAFPRTCDNGYVLFYDKRIFSESDLSSFDSMIAKAKSKNTNVYYSIGNAWYNLGIYFAAGCDISYDPSTRVQTAKVNTPEGLAAAKAMCHLAESEGNGFIGMGDDAAIASGFSDGSIAAAVTGMWNVPAMKKAIGAENIGAAKLPTTLINGSQVQLHSFGGYKLVGVNAFSKFPISSQALAYYLTNSENQLNRYLEKGYIPTAKTALEDENFKDDPSYKAMEDQREFAHSQGTSTSDNIWGSNIGGFGVEIVKKKGAVSDSELQAALAHIQNQIEIQN